MHVWASTKGKVRTTASYQNVVGAVRKVTERTNEMGE